MMRDFLVWFVGMLTYPVSLLTPRKSNKWCFGGVDNAKYLFLLHDWQKDGIECYWFGNDKKFIDKLRRLGYKAYSKTSLKGLYHLLTSKVYVFTHYVGDINRWTHGNARLVNLFHGLPYKKIGFDDPKHKRPLIHKIIYPTTLKKFDLQLSTSPFIETIFKRSFKIKNDRYVESLLPRNLLMFMSKDEIVRFLERIEDEASLRTIQKIERYSKSYIYMPTFRDSARDFIADAEFDFDRLNEVMKANDSLFIFKLHRATKSERLKDLDKYSNLLFIDNNIDVYPILPFTTGLITDYSSIYFDYILMPDKRVLFFTFDYDEYKSQDRDFNFDESYMKGEYCQTFNGLLELLSLDESQIPHIDQTDNIKLFWNDHKDVSELVDEITKLSRE